MDAKLSGGLPSDLRDLDVMGALARAPEAEKKTALDRLLAAIPNEDGNCFNNCIG
jgi:hypothetical protein